MIQMVIDNLPLLLGALASLVSIAVAVLQVMNKHQLAAELKLVQAELEKLSKKA